MERNRKKRGEKNRMGVEEREGQREREEPRHPLGDEHRQFNQRM